MSFENELSFSKNLGKTRLIDRIVYVTGNISETVGIFERIFGFSGFETGKCKDGETATVKTASGIELFIISPDNTDSVYRKYYDAYGKGIMGVRERIPLGNAGLWLDNIRKNSIVRIEEDKHTWWLDLTKELGCMYGLYICEDPIEKAEGAKNIGQICIVSDNTEKTAEKIFRYIGLGPWEIGFINSTTSEYFYSSEYSKEEFPDAEMRVGMNWFSNLEFELIEQVKGPMPYEKFLKRHGNGFQHMKEIIPPEKWQETLDGFAANNVGVALAGKLGPISFCNLDTEDLLGCVYELGEDRPLDKLPNGYNAYIHPAV